jgi:flagellar basal body-associated protein FliL
MKSFKLKKKSKINLFEALFMVLFFLAILVWVSFSFSKINATNTEEQLNETKQSIQKSVVLCYSIEGSFPPDIQYLKDNYGLIINDDKYIVHYDIFASNIMPDIAVFPRN